MSPYAILEMARILENLDNIQHIKLLDLKKPKGIVLIGGSGAGKSSFLKSLCQHGNLLGSVGDGQTTRATIVYELSTKNTNPRIIISFKKKKDFVDDRKKSILYRCYELILCNIYKMVKKDISSNPLSYLQDMVLPLSTLMKRESNEEKKDEVRRLLNEINHVIHSSDIEVDLEDFDDEIMLVYENMIQFLDDYSIKNHPNQMIQHGFFNKKKYETFKKQKIQHGVFNEKQNKDETIYDKYLAFILDTESNQVQKREEILVSDFKNLITREEGFFDISEFFFLGEQNEMKNYCNNLFEKYFIKNENLVFTNEYSQYFKENENDFEIKNVNNENDDFEVENADKEITEMTFNQRINAFYGTIYQKIAELMKKKGISVAGYMTYDLENTNAKELKIIACYMRKVGKDSLTSIVESVEVDDIFADQYAYDMHCNKIDRLVCYDTCGIDHIERMNPKIYFKDLFNKIKGKKKNRNGEFFFRRSIDAIVYVKKLDSEKPTELEKMLPIINGMEEATPIFCLFTAIDQYINEKNDFPDCMVWNDEFYNKWKNESEEYLFPKIVENMYENPSFVEAIQSPNYIKDKISKFILNHMVPFSAKYEVNDDAIIDLNLHSLLYIMNSILKDEWNIGFIPPTSEDGEVNKEGEDVIIIKKAIQEDLVKMFLMASRTNWSSRHNSTVRANFRRIYRYDENYDKYQKELGLTRTHIDRWDNLLEAGYSESFLSEDSNTIKILHSEWKVSKSKVYSVLSRLKNDIITENMGTWKNTEKKISDKNSEEIKETLRDYFEEMYANKDLFEINIFERQNSIGNYEDYREKVNFLDEVCNFEKVLLKSPEIKERIIQFIYDSIHTALSKDNFIFLNGLYLYDQKFKESIEYIENLIKNYSDEKFLTQENDNLNKKSIWEMIMKWNH